MHRNRHLDSCVQSYLHREAHLHTHRYALVHKNVYRHMSRNMSAWSSTHSDICVQRDPLSARSSTHRHLCVNRSTAHVCTYVHTHTQRPATQKVQPTRHPWLFLLALSSLLPEALSATNSPSTGSKESQPALPGSAELLLSKKSCQEAISSLQVRTPNT